MKLGIIDAYYVTSKLLRNIESECTPFAIREGVDYKGWFADDFDLGSSPSYFTEKGDVKSYNYTGVETSIRPYVKYSNIKTFCKVVKTIENGCLEIEFGEYPQYPAKAEVQAKLNQGLSEKTGKSYTLYNNDEQNPGTIELEEVIDTEGNKYVNKNNVWYKVSPISWIVDEKADIALTKQPISGGIPFGEYKLPEMTKWEKEYEERVPMKLPPSVRRMHTLRSINPTIIEGFINEALSKDIISDEKLCEIDAAIRASREKTRQEEEKEREERSRVRLNSDWLRHSMLRPNFLSPKLQRDDFFERLLNPQQTESERLLGELVDSLSDEGIKNEAEEKGLNPEETKVFVKRKVELRDTLKRYKK